MWLLGAGARQSRLEYAPYTTQYTCSNVMWYDVFDRNKAEQVRVTVLGIAM